MDIIRAAIYARVSTKPQAREDKVSIEHQLRECKKFIEKERWLCVGEFVDPGVTANTIERPGLKTLFASLEKFDVVLAWDFDRFYRERRSVAGYILDTLDENRKQITSIKQPIPIYDPQEYDPRQNDTPYLLREMAGLTSGMDNRRRFRTLQKGLQERFNQGYMIHMPPYGYEVAMGIENGKVVKLPRRIVQQEADIVRRIFREYIDGKSCREIALGLNANGIPTRKKPYWIQNSVNVILRNPVYCAKVAHTLQKANGRWRRLPEDQWTVVPGKHPPIVREQEWNHAQEVRRRKQRQPRAMGAPKLLSGLLRCGYCGWAMSRDGDFGGGYYVCRNFRERKLCQRNPVGRLQLEGKITAFLFRLLRSEDLFEKVRSRQEREKVHELKAEIGRLEKYLADFADRKSRLFDLYEGSQISKQEFVERKEEQARQYAAYQQALAEKSQRLAKMESEEINRETFREVLETLEQRWEQLDIMEKKRKLAALIEKIVIKDGSFKIHFRIGI